jgi:hypothetical protein
MTWGDRAAAVISSIHVKLPADADLKARKKALREGCPNEFRTTSWGRKVWSKVARAYLAPYGSEAKKSGADLPLLMVSPLDRAKAKWTAARVVDGRAAR